MSHVFTSGQTPVRLLSPFLFCDAIPVSSGAASSSSSSTSTFAATLKAPGGGAHGESEEGVVYGGVGDHERHCDDGAERVDAAEQNEDDRDRAQSQQTVHRDAVRTTAFSWTEFAEKGILLWFEILI